MKEILSGIYLITNIVNGKKYVGKSKSIHNRWYSHCDSALKRNSDTYFHRAIRKHTPSNFIIEHIDHEYTNEREIFWISEIQPEYNMTKGGDGGFINDQTGKRWKVKDTTRMKEANIKSCEKRKLIYVPKITGGNNYQSKYYIYTPYGVFETWRDATNFAKEQRENGNINVITDTATLKKYCMSDTLLSLDGRRTPKEWRGKYTSELGFKIKSKEV